MSTLSEDLGEHVLKEVAHRLVDVINASWHMAAGDEVSKYADETEDGRRYLRPLLDTIANLHGGDVQVFLEWAQRLEAFTVCDHVFEANPGLYDSQHRYCVKCGILEAAAKPQVRPC